MQAVPGLRGENGIVVAAVSGEADGLRPGDVIYGANATPVRTLADLRGIIGPLPSGGVAVLQIGRQGQLRFLTVVLE